MHKQVLPYEGINKNKKEQVAMMFDSIAPRYDFLNRFLSLGIDRQWRKKAIALLKKYNPRFILDVATGTGDLAIAAVKLNPEKITGVDISVGMLELGRKKISRLGLDQRIELREGDSENLPFEDQSFDAVMAAFGVRNFENIEKGLGNMYRVLKPGGVVVILEFSKPGTFPIKQLFDFYFKRLLPAVGRSVSGDKAAYSYLPQSVEAFPEGRDFLQVLEKCGFRNTYCNKLTFGIASLYVGEKEDVN